MRNRGVLVTSNSVHAVVLAADEKEGEPVRPWKGSHASGTELRSDQSHPDCR
jgi:hypothetical protein